MASPDSMMAVDPLVSFMAGLAVGLVGALLSTAGFVRDTRRRPEIRTWYFADGGETPYEPYYEGVVLEVIGRRREIEVDEIGLLVSFGPAFKRRQHELSMAVQRLDFPHTLKDGHTLRGGRELGVLIDDVWLACGQDERLRKSATLRGYVNAAGKTYRGHRLWSGWKDPLRRARATLKVGFRPH